MVSASPSSPSLSPPPVNGNDKTICVKNLETNDLTDYFYDLRNQVGRKVRLIPRSFLSSDLASGAPAEEPSGVAVPEHPGRVARENGPR
jgi:hypothetical protein